jgi:ParB/RepB/Spo0J family partition protein
MRKEVLQQIPLDLIDDPSVPMRSAMSEEKLDELARSIKTHGLIQPITIRKVRDRYEVVAGHRRFKACKRAGLAVVSAIVRELSNADADGMRMHENLYREDVNPVDEARYIRKMVDVHRFEPAQLAGMTGKSEQYLIARYELLDFPKYLVDALEAETISLTAAQWLNKISDDFVRQEYTRFAELGGITGIRAHAWYESWKAGTLPRDAAAYSGPVEPVGTEAKALEMPCVICWYKDDISRMRMEYAHQDCSNACRDAARTAQAAAAPAA